MVGPRRYSGHLRVMYNLPGRLEDLGLPTLHLKLCHWLTKRFTKVGTYVHSNPWTTIPTREGGGAIIVVTSVFKVGKQLTEVD